MPLDRRTAARNSARLAVPLALTLTLGACGINTIPTKEEAAKAAWAQVENQYQRRADLIPNLVATVQGYAKQEKDVLVGVTQARASANAIHLSDEDLKDPGKVAAYEQAQNHVSSSLVALRPLQEQYPDLKSNANFMALQSQLEGTENRITIARQDYNTAVQDYNTTIRTFPALIGAKVIYGAKPLVPFKATTVNAQVAPTVKF
jgi:LemA protein